MIAERLALRPRSLRAIADLGLQFVRQNALALAAPTATCIVPAVAVAAWLHDGGEPVWLWIQVAVIVAFSSAPLTFACADLAVQPTTSLRSCLRRARARLPALFGVHVAEWILRLPTLGLSTVLFQFAPEVVLLEAGGLEAATKRTRTLLSTVGFRWFTVPGLGVALIGWGAAGGEVGWSAFRALWALPESPSGLTDEGFSVAAAAGAAVGHAVWVVVRFLIYLDCRTRAEGWDLQLQCQALVAQHAAPSVVDSAVARRTRRAA